MLRGVAYRLAPLWLALTVIAAWGCDVEEMSPEREPSVAERFDAEARRAIARMRVTNPPPVDPTNAHDNDPRAARLGRMLFFEERLSAPGDVSCATCHDPDHGFSDPHPLSQAVGISERHAPTLLNVAYQRWFFWDGRADSLWSQALSPMEHPAEHGGDRVGLAQTIALDPALRAAYEEIYGPLPDLFDMARFPSPARPAPDDPLGPAAAAWAAMAEADREAVTQIFVNLGKALAAYQRQLVSVDSSFDRFAAALAEGDEEGLRALSPQAVRGLELFLSDRTGCTGCHHGPMLSDREFHNLGLPEAPGVDRADPGRLRGIDKLLTSPFNGLGPHSDAPDDDRVHDKIAFLARGQEQLGQFKTPSLRNVARTAPYMHGGHFATLEEVVRFYVELPSSVQLGHRDEILAPLDLDDQEIADLVTFLESLTGAPVPAQLRAP